MKWPEILYRSHIRGMRANAVSMQRWCLADTRSAQRISVVRCAVFREISTTTIDDNKLNCQIKCSTICVHCDSHGMFISRNVSRTDYRILSEIAIAPENTAVECTHTRKINETCVDLLDAIFFFFFWQMKKISRKYGRARARDAQCIRRFAVLSPMQSGIPNSEMSIFAFDIRVRAPHCNGAANFR